ncbi:PIN domain-containing protein [Janibacter hoylei]|uniref:PIN domain-containing protein n=1 Tax=Janibacter hoylei TaxID=364298 RepID=UPI002237DE92|nr:PIN domain-containing protein [Janibacter hoylei]MCW4602549.1 PIN domain-containing protein [Janibacter hoylei]
MTTSILPRCPKRWTRRAARPDERERWRVPSRAGYVHPCPRSAARLLAPAGHGGRIHPLWGTGILAELDYTLAALDARRGISGSESRRRRLMDQMRHAFPGAEVDSPKDRAYAYDVADPDDGHVAHAAIMGKADAIVTDDKRAGFTTATALIEAGIDTITPKVFAANTVAAHPQAGVAALKAMAGRRQNPVQSSPRSSSSSSSGMRCTRLRIS